MNEDEEGGFALLARQMMDAVGKQFAVHEISWQPSPEGLTAKFRFCPLWFFENRTNRLRFLPSEAVIDGEEMLPGEWLVTVGDGIMKASAVCWVYKSLSLKDWVSFSELFGFPIRWCKTDAAKGSKEWNDLAEAGLGIINESVIVTSRQDEITLIEASKTGDAPFQPLVDKMDQALTSLWRGGDLGTTSKKDHAGASLQSDESDILEQDDAQRISETLNIKVDRFVIAYQFGVIKPLAYIKILTSKKQDVPAELQIDQFLLSAGAPMAVGNALERYGREMPEASEPLLKAPVAASGAGPNAATAGPGAKTGPSLENSVRPRAPISRELLRNSLAALEKTSEEAVQPIRTRIEGILQIANEGEQRGALILLKAELPNLIPNAPEQIARTLANIISAGIFNGFAEGKEQNS